MPIQYPLYSMKKMAAFYSPVLFAILAFFCAYLLLHVDGVDVPSSVVFKGNAKHDFLKCQFCDQSIKVEKGKKLRQSMMEHLKSCKKFNESEEDEVLQEITTNFLKLVKEVDDKLNENIFKNFPRLALQTKELCHKFCNLNKSPIESEEELEENDPNVITLKKELSAVIEQVKELVNKEEKEKEVKLRELNKKLAKLHHESIPICDDAAMRVCEMRERLLYLQTHLHDNAQAQTFLEGVMPLTIELLNWTTTMAEQVDGFITTRKLKMYGRVEHWI